MKYLGKKKCLFFNISLGRIQHFSELNYQISHCIITLLIYLKLYLVDSAVCMRISFDAPNTVLMLYILRETSFGATPKIMSLWW